MTMTVMTMMIMVIMMMMMMLKMVDGEWLRPWKSTTTVELVEAVEDEFVVVSDVPDDGSQTAYATLYDLSNVSNGGHN